MEIHDFMKSGFNLHQINKSIAPLPAPEGYEKVAGNEYICIPVLPDCPFRGCETIEKKCCGKVKLYFCQRTKNRTTRQDCITCKKTQKNNIDISRLSADASLQMNENINGDYAYEDMDKQLSCRA